MEYQLIGDVMPAVEVRMQAGEKMYTQSGGMVWMSEGIKMETNTNGGVLKGFTRKFAGESMFMATYSATVNDATIAFASTVPGKILPIDLADSPMTCQKNAFLCAQPSVTLNTIFNKALGTGFFGGEGFILQELVGTGMAFLEVDGDIVVKELQPGEVIKIDTGNIVAFSKGMQYEIERIKGFKNIFLGGEGLFLTKLTGPGKVVLQTQNMGEFAGRIAKYMTTK
ncbi:MAG: TIGR00266 family protein [Lachnospiraceae bacterium]|nr:TIGR00266 family protein [Lachnospiraceae bacterium]